MAQIVTDMYGTKIGSYEGGADIGKVYDADGNYAGEYWGHEIFDKNGMSRGYYNGEPIQAVQILLMR